MRHDPIERYTPVQTAEWAEGKKVDGRPAGIVCTGSWMLPGYAERLHDQGVPIVVLERSIGSVNASALKLGLPMLSLAVSQRLEKLPGQRFDYEALFNYRARLIFYALFHTLRFDDGHHDELRRMKIEPTAEVIEGLKRKGVALERLPGA